MTTSDPTITVLPPDTPVADILDAAADAMAARGKCTGRFTDAEGRVCAFGALRLVLMGAAADGSAWRIWRTYMRAGTALHRHIVAAAVPATRFSDVVEWSDGSSQDDVVAGLRAAAERERSAVQGLPCEPDCAGGCGQ